MTRGTSILVVDDDPGIRDLVEEYLRSEGFRVATVPDGEAMRRALAATEVDLVVLDVRLPAEDGFSLALELRQRSDVGIIMLSQKEDVVDRVAGLEVGADDYLSKPFSLRELLARIRSVLRRRADQGAARSSDGQRLATPARYRFAGWELDGESRILVSPEALPVELSGGEFDLLLAFVEHPRRVLSRDQLLELARNRTATLFDRSVDVQVGRLRQKIESDRRRPALIRTVRGAGYMLAAEVERLR